LIAFYANINQWAIPRYPWMHITLKSDDERRRRRSSAAADACDK
jgi:hypothetical protein